MPATCKQFISKMFLASPDYSDIDSVHFCKASTPVLQQCITTAHPRLLNKPPPKALLTRLGPDWMGFELHAATDRIEDWMDVRSDLAVAVAAALVQAEIKLR